MKYIKNKMIGTMTTQVNEEVRTDKLMKKIRLGRRVFWLVGLSGLTLFFSGFFAFGGGVFVFSVLGLLVCRGLETERLGEIQDTYLSNR
jgi:hypothetical protein